MNKAWTDLRIYEGSVGLRNQLAELSERRVKKIILSFCDEATNRRAEVRIVNWLLGRK